jgi:hypothetical protein
MRPGRSRWLAGQHPKSITAPPPPTLSHLQVISVYIDASNSPMSYMQLMHEQCWSFPQKLVFFLYGSLQADYTVSGSYQLPAIDTYFVLDCEASKVRPAPGPRPG